MKYVRGFSYMQEINKQISKSLHKSCFIASLEELLDSICGQTRVSMVGRLPKHAIIKKDAINLKKKYLGIVSKENSRTWIKGIRKILQKFIRLKDSMKSSTTQFGYF